MLELVGRRHPRTALRRARSLADPEVNLFDIALEVKRLYYVVRVDDLNVRRSLRCQNPEPKSGHERRVFTCRRDEFNLHSRPSLASIPCRKDKNNFCDFEPLLRVTVLMVVSVCAKSCTFAPNSK